MDCRYPLHAELNRLVGGKVFEKRVRELTGKHLGVKRHGDALRIFERHEIKAYSQALSLLGYKVRWSGLDPENAEILKM